MDGVEGTEDDCEIVCGGRRRRKTWNSADEDADGLGGGSMLTFGEEQRPAATKYVLQRGVRRVELRVKKVKQRREK